MEKNGICIEDTQDCLEITGQEAIDLFRTNVNDMLDSGMNVDEVFIKLKEDHGYSDEAISQILIGNVSRDVICHKQISVFVQNMHGRDRDDHVVEWVLSRTPILS